METRQPTAQEQFIEDFLLVAQNDEATFFSISEVLIGYEENHYEGGQRLEEWVEIHYAQELKENLLLSQLLRGWGGDTWAKIAKEFLTD
jgi:hypothetical protein